MDNNRTKSEAEMDSVQLLASMLLCYPPITKVVLEPGGKSIALCFSMKKVPDPETFPAHQDFILDSLRLYHDIECSGQVTARYFSAMAACRLSEIWRLFLEESSDSWQSL